MRVIIFFTYGISLDDWKNSGLLEREVKLYDFLNKKYGISFIFITYGDDYDLEILDNSEHIKVIPLYKYFSRSKYKYIRILNSLSYPLKLKRIVPLDGKIMKTNQLWGAWVPLIIRLLNGNPLIVRTGYDLLTFKRNESVSKYKLAFYKLLTKYSIKYSEKYLVTSNQDLEKLSLEFSSNKNQVEKLSNWVDIPKINSFNERAKNVVSVGRLENQKNYAYMIDSFSNSELEIDIIGQGSKKEELASLAKVKNTKVNFLGTLSNEELLKMLPDYKYFVTSTLYEGNPKAILEAMASGCVVVAPNVPGVNEVIKHKVTGILYEFNSKNLLNIINDISEEECSKISMNASKFIYNNHSLDVIAKKEYEIYKELF